MCIIQGHLKILVKFLMRHSLGYFLRLRSLKKQKILESLVYLYLSKSLG